MDWTAPVSWSPSWAPPSRWWGCGAASGCRTSTDAGTRTPTTASPSRSPGVAGFAADVRAGVLAIVVFFGSLLAVPAALHAVSAALG